MRVLALNSGSSSLKLAVYEVLGDRETCLLEGEAAPIGDSARLVVRATRGDVLIDRTEPLADTPTACGVVLDELDRLGLGVEAVGHRVVHGGPDHSAPAIVDTGLIRTLEGLVPFAPLHLPAEIAVMRAVAERDPGLPQVACFDTAFYRAMPEVSQRYALPRWLWDAGVRRYGFHGLSYEYVLGELGGRAAGRMVIAHLGSGASLVAVRDHQPLDTTMGFTPTGGVIMGTRSGDLDPGVLIYLMREEGIGAGGLERMVNYDAGLLGVSGTTPDMKTLLDRRARDPAAALAIDMFCRRVRMAIGSFAAILGGLDGLVFTGGIGERGAPVRAEIVAGLSHLGLEVDPARNHESASIISPPNASVPVRVVHTREEKVIARHTADAISSARGGTA